MINHFIRLRNHYVRLLRKYLSAHNYVRIRFMQNVFVGYDGLPLLSAVSKGYHSSSRSGTYLYHDIHTTVVGDEVATYSENNVVALTYISNNGVPYEKVNLI